LTEPALRKIYDRSVAKLKRPEGELLLSFDEVQKSTTRLDQARSYANRLGVRFNGGPGAFFMNGVFNTVDDVRMHYFAVLSFSADRNIYWRDRICRATYNEFLE
jgi:hypothetical protein